jgi:hypothetical protein
MTHIQMKEVGEVVLGEDEVEGLDDGPMNGEELILVWKISNLFLIHFDDNNIVIKIINASLLIKEQKSIYQ